MQRLDVLEPLQQRRQLSFDCLLDHLPRALAYQIAQAQTDFR
jgi:hypothetical protein